MSHPRCAEPIVAIEGFPTKIPTERRLYCACGKRIHPRVRREEECVGHPLLCRARAAGLGGVGAKKQADRDLYIHTSYTTNSQVNECGAARGLNQTTQCQVAHAKLFLRAPSLHRGCRNRPYSFFTRCVTSKFAMTLPLVGIG